MTQHLRVIRPALLVLTLLLATPLVSAQATLTSWGDGFHGQTAIPGDLGEVIGFSAGGSHSLALKADGTVVAWGSNNIGQTDVPAGLTGVVSVSAGFDHSLALLSDGTVVGWGNNTDGGAIPYPGLTGVVEIDAGFRFSLALLSDGTITGWGKDVHGRITGASGLTGVVDVAAGRDHGVALLSDGTVGQWGSTAVGQNSVPADLTDVVGIAAGDYHSLAVTSDGTVRAWGNNTSGQAAVPAGAVGGIAVSAGGSYSVVLKSDGTVVAWGNNNVGQTNVPNDLANSTAISAGDRHTLALVGESNEPPTADAGADLTFEATGADTDVALDGTGSSDPNGDALTYSWAVGGTEVATGATPTVSLPIGTTTVTLTVSDGQASATDVVVVTLLWSTLAVSGPAVVWPLDAPTLAVDATDAGGLYGLRADLGYDQTRLAFVGGSLAAGSLFADGAPQLVFTDFADTGVFEFTTGRTDGNAAFGNGTTASLAFDVADYAAPGLADFTLTGIDAIDPAGDAFSFDEVAGGSFMVGGVWPGDLDSDCSVDVFDLLPIGAFYDATGPARLGDRDLTWGAKAFSPWGGSSAHADFAQSFADSDGNGEVDASDLLAILVNYGHTHGAETGCTPPGATLVAGGPLAVSLDAPVGTTVAFDVALAGGANGLVGVGLALDHGATGATVTAVEAGPLMAGALEVVRIDETVAQAAFTHRGAAEAVSGAGPVVRVTARVDAPDARLVFTRVALTDADGGTTEVDPSGGAVETSEARAVSNATAPEALTVALAPNPARSSARLALVAPEAGEVSVSVYDALGRVVASLDRSVSAGATELALPVSGLAPGLYVVRTQIAGQVVSQTLTVAR